MNIFPRKSPRSIGLSLLAAGMVLSGCTLSSGQEEPAAKQPSPTFSSSEAPAPQELKCEHPRLDLNETQYGLWNVGRNLPVEIGGEDDGNWLATQVVDNHFDPCADFSYITIKVTPPKFFDSSFPHKEMVLFFAGEDLILEQKMPALDEVRQVEITGSVAKVNYRSMPPAAMGKTFDYQMDYQLAAHEVTELGEHVPENHGQFMRSDFDRFPPPGDGGIYLQLGNVSYHPYDYEEDWSGFQVTVPIENTTMECVLEEYEDFHSIELIVCQAKQAIFPAVDLRLIKTPLLDPGKDKYSTVEILPSNPVSAYTDNMPLPPAKDFAEMKDEAITQVGRFIFDTRGDSVRVSNGSWEFILSATGITHQQSKDLDMSRWPTDLQGFGSVG